MQAMNRFVEYFGAYMDEAGRLVLADAAVVGMSTYHDRRELHIALQLPALVETAELERCADQIAAQMGLEKAVLTPHYASAAFSADCLPSLIANIRRHHAEVNGFFKDAKATVNGNTLHIDLQYGGREVLLAKGTDKLLAQEIHKLFDLELAVEFVEAKTYDIEAAVRSAVAEKQEAEKQKKEEAEKPPGETIPRGAPLPALCGRRVGLALRLPLCLGGDLPGAGAAGDERDGLGRGVGRGGPLDGGADAGPQPRRGAAGSGGPAFRIPALV